MSTSVLYTLLPSILIAVCLILALAAVVYIALMFVRRRWLRYSVFMGVSLTISKYVNILFFLWDLFILVVFVSTFLELDFANSLISIFLRYMELMTLSTVTLFVLLLPIYIMTRRTRIWMTSLFVLHGLISSFVVGFWLFWEYSFYA